jgi:hypothetical protein
MFSLRIRCRARGRYSGYSGARGRRYPGDEGNHGSYNPDEFGRPDALRHDGGVNLLLVMSGSQWLGHDAKRPCGQECKQWLTQHNQTPRGDCVVCLMPFTEEGLEFMKTPCYHHVHVPCFAAYAEAETKEAWARVEESRRNGLRGMPCVKRPIKSSGIVSWLL